MATMSVRRAWERAHTLEELQDLLLEEPGLFGERRPSLDTPSGSIPLAFIDAETTGLEPEAGDRILEIAIERIEPDGGERRFVEIFDPGRAIPVEVQRIHAIRPAQLRSCRGFDAAATEIVTMLDGAVWVGHNLSFDVRFLRWEMRRAGKTLRPAWILDTMFLARRWCPLTRYSLESVARYFGMGGRNLHQALDDILTTRAVFPPLLSMVAPSPRTLRDLLTAMLPAPRSVT
jgi:DNA polymerase III epsilon subunit-like protein